MGHFPNAAPRVASLRDSSACPQGHHWGETRLSAQQGPNRGPTPGPEARARLEAKEEEVETPRSRTRGWCPPVPPLRGCDAGESRGASSRPLPSQLFCQKQMRPDRPRLLR